MNKKVFIPYLMWLLPVSFFAFQFILRLFPGLIIQPIMIEFAVTASDIGILASLYYWGYAGMQIPVAYYLDKYSVRTVIFCSTLLCGLATILFVYSPNWYLACLSRLLIGVGSAVGFLGVSKIISQWFAKESYAKMVGFSFSIGLMGAIYGGKPVSILIENNNWRSVSLVLASISISLGLIVLIFLRAPNKNKETTYKELSLTNFKKIISSKSLILLAIANFLMVGPLEGFADIWGISYLMTMYNLPKSEAAELVSFIFIGMLFGGPALAFLSSKLGDFKIIALSGLAMTLILFFILFFDYYNWFLLAFMFFTLGIFCCYQVLVFSAGSLLVMPKHLGIAVAFLNSVNMLGGSFFHTIIGKLMDYFWSGSLNENGIKIYDIYSYYKSLSAVPIFALVGSLIIVYLSYSNKKILS